MSSAAWDLIHSAIAVLTAIGGLVALWWKMSSDTKMIRRDLAVHDEKISKLELHKAEETVLVKLASLVAELEKTMILHHTNAEIHRTKDSEKRMDDLMRNVDSLIRENREAHDKIMQVIDRVREEK